MTIKQSLSNTFFRFILGKIKRFPARLNVAEKFGYSYALAIGIAILGTSAGLVVGEYYQQRALERLALAETQEDLLSHLENSVLKMRSHPQELLPSLGSFILFDYAKAHFYVSSNQVKSDLKELNDFITENPKFVLLNPTYFNEILQNYDRATSTYIQLIETLWQQVNPDQITNIPAAQKSIVSFLNQEKATKLNLELNRLSEDLAVLLSAAENQEYEAYQQLEAAKTLRRQIILVSILLSSAIAILLAIQTSRTITRPLQAVTEVAQKVTLESNFNLQAPVLTEDEVGVLAISLNQLMAKVRERTQELEEARETLEHKVKERTQELTEALAELKQAQAQLIQSEKMSSLGQMVAGIAHEINNPVNFIYGNIQPANQYVEDLIYILKIYEQEYPNPTPKLEEQIEAVDLDFVLDDLPKLFSSMKMGAERIRQIVLSLRNFSRLDESEMKRVDIHEGIESTLVILNNRLKKGIEVKKNYGNIPWVECYPAQINQVFMNLLNNAIDALEDTKRQKNFLPCLEIMTQQINHQEISIQIRDNGTGIPDDIKAKLFDPFFTTKDVGKGTGLGLSISYKIVEKHSGKIKVESELGKGTEFAIALPISQQ